MQLEHKQDLSGLSTDSQSRAPPHPLSEWQRMFDVFFENESPKVTELKARKENIWSKVWQKKREQQSSCSYSFVFLRGKKKVNNKLQQPATEAQLAIMELEVRFCPKKTVVWKRHKRSEET